MSARLKEPQYYWGVLLLSVAGGGDSVVGGDGRVAVDAAATAAVVVLFPPVRPLPFLLNALFPACGNAGREDRGRVRL